MELVTHALLGAAAGLAIRGATVLPRRDCVGLACAGAIFPDIDFFGFLVSPLRFLADWHQGATHSLLLLPIWAVFAAGLYAWWRAAWNRLGAAALLFSAGVASHVGLDVATAYGTMLFYPASDQRFSLGLLYVVDPFFTLAVVLSVLVLQRWRQVPALLTACSLLGGYLAVTAYAHSRALEIARWCLHSQCRWSRRQKPFGLLAHRTGPCARFACPPPASRNLSQGGSGWIRSSSPSGALQPTRRSTRPRRRRNASGLRISGMTCRDCPRLYGFCPGTQNDDAWQLYRLPYFSTDRIPGDPVSAGRIAGQGRQCASATRR